jgi:Uma2 family endonuclease
VAGDPRASAAAHPADPALVIEVADTSLAFDREHKASLYARAGVPDYWIVNLIDEALEVHRDPAVAPLTPFGWRYRERQVLHAGASISPLAAPAARILVADLLP